jgi:oligoendopeptidase F
MTTNRSDVDLNDTWNLTNLYENDELWQKDYETNKDDDFDKKITAFKGNLQKGSKYLKELFDLYFKKLRSLEKIYTFAHLKHDEEITYEKYKNMQEKAEILLQHFSEITSWIEPEIFLIPESTLKDYLKDPSFNTYFFHLQKIIRLKEHILSPKEEELLALASRALQTPYKTFSSINNADFVFPNVNDSNGNSLELTHGKYQIYLQSRDRLLRENAFKTLHKKFSKFSNTLADLVHGQVLKHQFEAKARNFNSCLEAALKPKDIDLNVYKTLIKAVKNNLSPLHDYIDLRKKLLNLDSIHLWDMNVALTKEIDIKLNYQEAQDLVIQSVAPLGQEYQDILKKGLESKRWVDRYENKNKRSGAYSSGCFDSEPYILMNFKGVLRDLSTLAHECGHSMHSLYSRNNQPFHYSQYPIFVAEVASTFNEELLFHLLLENAKDKETKIYYLTSRIDDLRATLFRQTLFAEFELKIHELVEQNIPLTPQLLSSEYKKLNDLYFGSNIVIDEDVAIEWARIPHFYYNFYVYQYATGISAAIALAKKVINKEANAKEAYLTFLKGGCSKFPIDLLIDAGIDMTTEQPVKDAIDHFKFLTNELKKLTLE